MLIFREFFITQSHQNTHQNAPYFQFFSGELAYAPEPPPLLANACNYNIIIST